MNLIIVESPTKARTLSRFLGAEFKIDSTMGHVRDLPKSTLGVDLKDDFKPEYVMVAKREGTIKQLKKEAKSASKVYLATDPDREGEAISYHIKYLLSHTKKPANGKFARIVFHEITREAVTEALEHPRAIDLQLVRAQTARRVLDRLVGYKLSPLLWRKVRRGLSAGRVQSVAVRLIVEREREIEKFKKEEYWEVYVNVKAQSSNVKSGEFTIQLIKIGDKVASIKDGKHAKEVVTDLQKADYVVKSVVKKEVSRGPRPPFTTSTMTQVSSNLFGWSAKRTMSVAQKLYEEGLITYHRTDSVNLATQAVNSARAFINKEFGKEFLPGEPRFYKIKSKLAQEAHEAIRPTDVGRISNDQIPRLAEDAKSRRANSKFGQDEEKLYSLIWKRFVSCQMANAIYDETRIDVAAGSYLLRASGQIIKFAGWKAVYGSVGGDGGGEATLPEVEESEALHLIKVDPQQKFTEAPPRYTEASLIKTLEGLGIGRPSTYAPTISTIQVRQYVEKQQGAFQPTSIGLTVNDFLVKYFPSIVDYQFTAGMEGDLDKIAEGVRKWVPVIRDFWQPFWAKVKDVEKVAERMKIEVEKTGKKCPKCGQGDEVIRTGRFGKFLSCSRFPDCDWKAPFIETLDMKCPGCRKGMVVVKKTGKGWRFYGCSRYPDCKWASWRNPEGKQEKAVNSK